jgi:hypothetical protein
LVVTLYRETLESSLIKLPVAHRPVRMRQRIACMCASRRKKSDNWPPSSGQAPKCQWLDRAQYDRIRMGCRRCASTMTRSNALKSDSLRGFRHPRSPAIRVRPERSKQPACVVIFRRVLDTAARLGTFVHYCYCGHDRGRECPPVFQESHGCPHTPGARSSLKIRSASITASPDASGVPLWHRPVHRAGL